MSDSERFHRGEQAIQSRVGVRNNMARVGARAIRDSMPDQHRAFFEQIPSLYYGALDAEGRPWGAVLSGPPGFMVTPNDRQLDISAQPAKGDPVFDSLNPGDPVGLLGLVFASRRRNRANGLVRERDSASLSISILQSFGNCPKYIQQRSITPGDATVTGEAASRSRTLGEPERAIIASSDTFFIATHVPADQDDGRGGMDMSHRGGKPGFVHVIDDRVLVWPDFNGNQFFNTLGNLVINPKCGLLFTDYAHGDLLYMTGSAEILWEDESVTGFAGAERMVRFVVNELVRAPGAISERWTTSELSPFLEHTGNWAAALGDA